MNYSSFEIEKVNVLEVPVVLDQYLAAWKLVLIFAPHDLAVCLLKVVAKTVNGACPCTKTRPGKVCRSKTWACSRSYWRIHDRCLLVRMKESTSLSSGAVHIVFTRDVVLWLSETREIPRLGLHARILVVVWLRLIWRLSLVASHCLMLLWLTTSVREVAVVALLAATGRTQPSAWLILGVVDTASSSSTLTLELAFHNYFIYRPV